MSKNSKGQFTNEPRPEKRTGKIIPCQWCGKSTYVIKSRMSEFKYCSFKCSNHKGVSKNTGRTHFKRGKIFHGTSTKYKILHRKIGNLFGKPDRCENCGKTGLKTHQIHWANKSGKYLEIRADWLRLCPKCHFAYDHRVTRNII